MLSTKQTAETGNAACIYGLKVTNWLNPNNAPPLIFRFHSIKKSTDLSMGDKIGIPKQFKAPSVGVWEAPS